MMHAVLIFLAGAAFGSVTLYVCSHNAAGYFHGHAHASAYWKRAIEFAQESKIKAEEDLRTAEERIKKLENSV